MSDPITILAHAESDMPIPPVAVIRARAAELRSDATRQQDTATVAQLTRLIAALDTGVRMCWALGDLLVSSASTPGVVYTVSCGRCNCPAYVPCKHLALFDLLVTMFDDAATDADFEADADEPAAREWRIGNVVAQRMAETRLHLRDRLIQARRGYVAAL